MTAGDELYARIVASPEDDAPRVAYADWLVARGDPRGEYIQCELAIARRGLTAVRDEVDARAHALFAAHEKESTAPFEAVDAVVSFACGLPYRARATGRAILAASELLMRHPIRELWFYPSEPGDVAALAQLPLLSQLRALELNGSPTGRHLDAAGLRALAPRLGNLRKLSMYHCTLDGDGAAGLAAGALEEVVLAGAGIFDGGGAALGAARWDRVESVRMADNELGRNTASAFACNPRLGRLARLDLTQNRIDDAGAAALAHSALLPALVELQLARNTLGEVGTAAFARAPERRGLVTRDLGGCRIGGAGASALAESRSLAELARLVVTECDLGVSGTTAFVERSGLPALRELAISRNGILTAAYEDYTDWSGTVVGGGYRPEALNAIRARFATRWPELRIE